VPTAHEPLISAAPRLGEGRAVGEEALLGAYDVDKRFPGVHAVRNATFEIHAGQVHCLVGENGAGKSTLVKMLAGVYRPEAGTIRIAGQPTVLSSPAEALRRGISTIFQELMLAPEMTIAENILLGREPLLAMGVLNRRERMRRVESIFESMGVEGLDPSRKVASLGIAHQQLVEVAKALSLEGERVLIMDEPTAPLTAHEIERLFQLIHRLRSRGLGILYITHRLEELEATGDVVTVMRDGSVVQSSDVAAVSRENLIEAMVGRKIAALHPSRSVPPGETVLEVRGATVTRKVHNVSFRLRRGEVLGVFGLVGAGRTELVRGIVGADRLSAGEVLVNGRPHVFRSPRHAIDSGVGFVPEDRKRHGIVPLMTVAANISLSSLRALSRVGFISPVKLHRLASDYTRRLDIRARSVSETVANLSGGNQQKAIIARSLAADPAVMILDEPTRGVDVGARTELYLLINKLCAEGRAVLMVTSDVHEAIGVSDRVLVMRQGRIVGEVAKEDASEKAIMTLAFGEEPLSLWRAPNGGGVEDATDEP
jgi:ABC-type sugar transport system ATPase subunit